MVTSPQCVSAHVHDTLGDTSAKSIVLSMSLCCTTRLAGQGVRGHCKECSIVHIPFDCCQVEPRVEGAGCKIYSGAPTISQTTGSIR